MVEEEKQCIFIYAGKDLWVPVDGKLDMSQEPAKSISWAASKAG